MAHNDTDYSAIDVSTFMIPVAGLGTTGDDGRTVFVNNIIKNPAYDNAMKFIKRGTKFMAEAQSSANNSYGIALITMIMGIVASFGDSVTSNAVAWLLVIASVSSSFHAHFTKRNAENIQASFKNVAMSATGNGGKNDPLESGYSIVATHGDFSDFSIPPEVKSRIEKLVHGWGATMPTNSTPEDYVALIITIAMSSADTYQEARDILVSMPSGTTQERQDGIRSLMFLAGVAINDATAKKQKPAGK